MDCFRETGDPHMQNLLKTLLTLTLTLTALALSGCATLPPDKESDIPWNVPQAWEGGGSFFPTY
jgi:hypothetical protein